MADPAARPAQGVLADAAPAQPQQQADPRMRELVDLVVSRVLQVLVSQSREVTTAMQGDPIRAAIEFGTAAVREVANAAEEAQGPLPFEVLMVAGVEITKYLADVANQKGLLPDDQIETFLKEVFQQSFTKYLDADVRDGRVPPEQMAQGREAAPTAPAAPAAPARSAPAGVL